MCQSQISFQTKSSKSNTSELLCLSRLPATLMMIRSKMNELAWRHHFPNISLWEIFRCWRAAHSLVSGPVWPKFELVWDFMHVIVTWSRWTNWLQRYSSSKVWNFCHSRASNSKTSGLIRPKIEFVRSPMRYQQLWWWFNKKWTRDTIFPLLSLREIF